MFKDLTSSAPLRPAVYRFRLLFIIVVLRDVLVQLLRESVFLNTSEYSCYAPQTNIGLSIFSKGSCKNIWIYEKKKAI